MVLGKRPWTRSIPPKFSKIPVQNQMEQEISRDSFRKFRSTFPEIWKFREFSVPFDISTHESASSRA